MGNSTSYPPYAHKSPLHKVTARWHGVDPLLRTKVVLKSPLLINIKNTMLATKLLAQNMVSEDLLCTLPYPTGSLNLDKVLPVFLGLVEDPVPAIHGPSLCVHSDVVNSGLCNVRQRLLSQERAAQHMKIGKSYPMFTDSPTSARTFCNKLVANALPRQKSGSCECNTFCAFQQTKCTAYI